MHCYQFPRSSTSAGCETYLASPTNKKKSLQKINGRFEVGLGGQSKIDSFDVEKIFKKI